MNKLLWKTIFCVHKYFHHKNSCIRETLNLLTNADRSGGRTDRRTHVQKLSFQQIFLDKKTVFVLLKLILEKKKKKKKSFFCDKIYCLKKIGSKTCATQIYNKFLFRQFSDNKNSDKLFFCCKEVKFCKKFKPKKFSWKFLLLCS